MVYLDVSDILNIINRLRLKKTKKKQKKKHTHTQHFKCEETCL